MSFQLADIFLNLPLKFDEAVSDLLKVKPEAKKAETDKNNTGNNGQ